MSAQPTFALERDFQAAVVELARRLGCAVYHTHDSRRSQPGWPDLVIVGHKRFIIRELKTQTGRLSDAQNEWISRLARAGVDVGVWRPSDWPHPIHEQLRSL